MTNWGGNPRPGRRMPSLYEIAAHWAPLDVFCVDLQTPSCFGCDMIVPADMSIPARPRWNGSNSFLDRAHLVDRRHDGLDGPQNLVPLCRLCHRLMPPFTDGHAALAWVLAGGGWPVLAAKAAPLAEALLAGSLSVAEFGIWWAKVTGVTDDAASQIIARATAAVA